MSRWGYSRAAFALPLNLILGVYHASVLALQFTQDCYLTQYNSQYPLLFA